MPIYAAMVQRIRRFFARQQVADITAIKEAMGTSSRTTVFRLLSKIGYQTSCSHAGGYYTLHDIPDFNVDGLWSCRGALFSKHRTLRATILHDVNTAPAGHTDQELQARLGLRVRDTLLNLVQTKEISRRSLARLYLYVSADHQKAQTQIAQRQRLLAVQPPPAPLPETGLVIEVLLAVINQPKADSVEVVAILSRQNRAISREQVEAVFARYDLAKKKLP